MARFDWWQVKGARWPSSGLRKLGFRRALLPWGEMNARFRARQLDFEGMAGLAKRLIELGFHFGAGSDWSPSEVVQDLRDRGLLNGPIAEIFWTGSEGWRTREI
jgi:hypothetical protein